MLWLSYECYGSYGLRSANHLLTLTFNADIHCWQERRRRGDNNMQLFLGDIYALQGKYADAAKIYKKIGQPSRALTMYTDLRMFDLAKVSNGAIVSYNF